MLFSYFVIGNLETGQDTECLATLECQPPLSDASSHGERESFNIYLF